LKKRKTTGMLLREWPGIWSTDLSIFHIGPRNLNMLRKAASCDGLRFRDFQIVKKVLNSNVCFLGNNGTMSWAVSVPQNLQEPKTDGYVFWDQNLCIIFDAHSPISLTGIDKIQYLSSICIHIILLIFTIYHSSSKQAMTQNRSYSCDKMMMRQAELDISDLITKFL
jgi:hypothetical protein